jgi:hypothetical protein
MASSRASYWAMMAVLECRGILETVAMGVA